MARRIWQDRVVERPRTFNIQNNPDGSVTLVPAPGQIIQEGTPVNAANLNGLEEDLQELFTNVSNGKTLVGGAITDVDDNVVIPTDPTFQQLADAIGQISTGKKWASGTVVCQTHRSWQFVGSTSTASGYEAKVSGLNFEPSTIVLYMRRSSFMEYTLYNKNSVSDFYPRTAQMFFVSNANASGIWTVNVKADALYAYVNGTGFNLPAREVGTYNWIAYE